MADAQAVIIAAARKLAADFKHVPGITSIQPAIVRGVPVIAVLAVVPRPRSFPAGVNVAINGRTVTLRIDWRAMPNPLGVEKGYFGTGPQGRHATPVPVAERDKPIDDAMWGGATPVSERPVTIVGPQRVPDIAVVEEIPRTDEQRYQLSVGARLPQFVTPNFWSIPFDREGDVCTPFYETWYTVFTYTVPSDRMVIVTGISYQFNANLIPFDHFDVEVFRSGQSLGIFGDMRALNVADPAEEYVLAGHYRPLPYYGRFDHDERIAVRVRVRGPYPFIHASTDPLGGCVNVFLTGWMATLYDNRDGGARPIDMADLNQLALGEKQS